MKDLLVRLEELETEKFMLQMADHWTQEDYSYNNKLSKEIRELKEQLKALGWEG